MNLTRMKTPQKRKSEKAFTFAEIIAVIAIMVVTGGLLLVVFNKVRQTGYQASCIGNLKNMGQSLQMYIEDYRLKYPNAANWYTILHDNYLEGNSEIFVCPAASTWSYGASMGYGMNVGISMKYSPEYDQRNTLFVTELSSAGYQISGLTGSSIATRHRNGANSVYADGSVSWHLKTWYSNRDMTDTL